MKLQIKISYKDYAEMIPILPSSLISVSQLLTGNKEH